MPRETNFKGGSTRAEEQVVWAQTATEDDDEDDVDEYQNDQCDKVKDDDDYT